MDEAFVDDGLASNRYLKAHHLTSRFEEQVFEALDSVCRSAAIDHPDLIDPEQKISRGQFEGRTIRTIRSEVPMRVENDEGNNLTLNVGLEWVEPHDQPDGVATVTDDVLCYALYKIKYGTERAFEAVRSATLDKDRWRSLRFGEEKFDTPPKVAPGIVYYPVHDGSTLSEGIVGLEDHFTSIYAPAIER